MNTSHQKRLSKYVDLTDRNAIFTAGLILNARWDRRDEQIVPYTHTFEEMVSLLHVLRYVGLDTDTDIYAWGNGEVVTRAVTNAASYSCTLRMTKEMVLKRLSLSRKVHSAEPILTAIPFTARMEGEALILQSPSRTILLHETDMQITETIKGALQVTEKTFRSRAHAINHAVKAALM